MHWYTDVLKKYAVFKGRATRQEYWMFVLLNFAISIAVGIVGSIFDIKQLGNLYSLAVLVPGLAVAARRLHDTGKSAWWLLLVFVPILGWIALIIFLIMESQSGANQYGPNPKILTTPNSVPVVEKTQEASPSEEVVINEIPTADPVIPMDTEEKI